MDTSAIEAMESAAAALGSATKHIGAASYEIGRVVAPAARSAIQGIPSALGKTIDRAKNGPSAADRKRAAATLGIGVACVAVLAVATFAHFSHKIRKSRILRDHKRQVTAALKRERAIDEALSRATAMRAASAVIADDAKEQLASLDVPGCYAILTYDPDAFASDPSAYRDVYVGVGASMLQGAIDELEGKGNLYVHADMAYKRPVCVAFFACEEPEAHIMYAKLVDVLGADSSYNGVEQGPENTSE